MCISIQGGGEAIDRLVGERRGEDIVRRKERVEDRVEKSVYKSSLVLTTTPTYLDRCFG